MCAATERLLHLTYFSSGEKSDQLISDPTNSLGPIVLNPQSIPST